MIREFQVSDTEAVVALWDECDLLRPWNDPRKDIARKLTVQPELFLVAEEDGVVIAAGMAGFDGHRGWINYLAVSPARQGQGLGRLMVEEFERRLEALGCPKVNLQVRTGNESVIAFYEALGFVDDRTVSLGKRLIAD